MFKIINSLDVTTTPPSSELYTTDELYFKGVQCPIVSLVLTVCVSAVQNADADTEELPKVFRF